VFDSQLRLSLHSRLVATSGDTATIVLTTHAAPADAEQALVDAGCDVYRIPPSGEGRVEIEGALRLLASLGIVSLLVEGGAELAGSLLATRFAHEMHAFLAPILLGPRGRPGAVDWAGPDRPAEAPRIDDPAWECCGADAYVFGRLLFPEREE
jgi:diaminohydroxyphosphoribosylaminopyrimidine deaminase/5-amino-6-(5-phosphoribosylamino)uracil reductase